MLIWETWLRRCVRWLYTFVSQSCHTHMRDMTHSYESHDVYCKRAMTHLYETWGILQVHPTSPAAGTLWRDLTLLYQSHVILIWETGLIRMGAMTCTWREPWLIHMSREVYFKYVYLTNTRQALPQAPCDMVHLYYRRILLFVRATRANYSFIWETWSIHMKTMTYSHGEHDSFISEPWHILQVHPAGPATGAQWYGEFSLQICITIFCTYELMNESWPIHVRDMTHLCERRDSFARWPWLIRMRDMAYA